MDDTLGEKALGTTLWNKESAALNQQADVVLRTNTLKTTKNNLRAILKEADIQTETVSGQRRSCLTERKNVLLLKL